MHYRARNLLRCLAPVALAAALSACAGLEVQNARSVQPKGTAFQQALHGEYLKLAESEFAQGDYDDSDFYALRAIEAGGGKDVAPTEMKARTLPQAFFGELFTARRLLTEAFEKGARDKAPAAAAKAQASFDCWMEQQEENFQADDIQACKKAYNDAMRQVEAAVKTAAPAAPARPAPAPPAMAAAPVFEVYFGFASAELPGNADQVIGQAIAAARKEGASRIVVTGHTDTSGATPYNDRLSRRRAEAVAAHIRRLAQPREFDGKIAVQAMGESRPAKQTADNVKEWQNRRAVITLSK